LVPVGKGYRKLKSQPGLMMQNNGGPLVPGERIGTKGGHVRVKKILENHWEALTHTIFHTKYTHSWVRGFELVTSSLAHSFLTISPTQHI
jgi:hypothetical protein